MGDHGGLCTQIVLKDKVWKYFTTCFKNMNVKIDSKMETDLKKAVCMTQQRLLGKMNCKPVLIYIQLNLIFLLSYFLKEGDFLSPIFWLFCLFFCFFVGHCCIETEYHSTTQPVLDLAI